MKMPGLVLGTVKLALRYGIANAEGTRPVRRKSFRTGDIMLEPWLQHLEGRVPPRPQMDGVEAVPPSIAERLSPRLSREDESTDPGIIQLQ